jgi:hypothetical protein
MTSSAWSHTHTRMTHMHPHMHTCTHVNQRSPKHVSQHRIVLRSTYHSTISLRVCRGAPMKLLGVHRPSVMGVTESREEYERLQKSPSCAGGISAGAAPTKAPTVQPT